MWLIIIMIIMTKNKIKKMGRKMMAKLTTINKCKIRIRKIRIMDKVIMTRNKKMIKIIRNLRLIYTKMILEIS